MLISAGVDVYAKDYRSQTATMVAKRRGKFPIWAQALEFCGFDVDEVFEASRENSASG
jgi:hypothetical protein